MNYDSRGIQAPGDSGWSGWVPQAVFLRRQARANPGLNVGDSAYVNVKSCTVDVSSHRLREDNSESR